MEGHRRSITLIAFEQKYPPNTSCQNTFSDTCIQAAHDCIAQKLPICDRYPVGSRPNDYLLLYPNTDCLENSQSPECLDEAHKCIAGHDITPELCERFYHPGSNEEDF